MMKHDLITIPDLRDWGACWFNEKDDTNGLVGEKRLLAASSGRSSMSCREICALEISHVDKTWVLTHALYRRDPRLCYDYATWCVDRALEHLMPEPLTAQCRWLRQWRASAARYAAARSARYAADIAASSAAAVAGAAADAAAVAAAVAHVYHADVTAVAHAVAAADAAAAAAAVAAVEQIERALALLGAS